MNDDGNCRSVTREMLCSSTIIVDGDLHPVFNGLSSSKHKVDPISCRTLPTGHLYGPDSITTDCFSMPDVLCIAEQTNLYVDDCRFTDRLASFLDDSFDNDENELPSRTTQHRQSAPHHANVGLSDNAVEYQQWPTSVVDQTARKAFPVVVGGPVNDVNKPVHASGSLDDPESVLMKTSSDLICQSLKQPKSTTYAKLSFSDSKNQSPVADGNSLSESNSQSVSTMTESVKGSFSLCHIERADRKDGFTLVASAFKVNENTVHENRFSEEIKGGTDTPTDVVSESKTLHGPSLDTSSRKLSSRVDKADGCEHNEDGFSCYGDVETEENTLEMNGCSVAENSDNDTPKHEIFDISTSIGLYDRIDNYSGLVNRRKQISRIKELPKQGLRVPSYHIAKLPSSDSVQTRECSEKCPGSLGVDSTALSLSTASATNQPHITHPDETPGVTEYKMSDAGSFSQFHSSDSSKRFETEVRTFDTLNRQNRTTENRDNVAERDFVSGAKSNCSHDECSAASSVTLTSCSLKDNIIVRNDSSTFTSPNSVPVSACTTLSADTDCEVEYYCTSFPQNVDKQIAASDATPDAKTLREKGFPDDLSNLDSASNSCDENKRQSGVRTTQLATASISTEIVARDAELSGLGSGDVDGQSQRRSSTTARNSSFVMVEIDIGEGRRSLPADEHRRRLEAMKKQLLNAKPVAPPSASIDSVWNSRIAGKLTPAARSRSAVWTPYDAFFSDETSTRPSATSDRMWRTTSLQAIPGIFTSVEFCRRSSGSTIDFGSKNDDSAIKDCNRQAEISSSLSDLRRVPTDDTKLQVYDIGSIDSGLNTEKKIPSSAAAPLRPLPSEEFIRRSLERLHLPDWYLNSSSLLVRKKTVGSGRADSNGSVSSTTSCPAVDIGKSKMADRHSLTSATSHVTNPPCVAWSPVTSANVATSVSSCKGFKMPDSATIYRFDSTESLQQSVDPQTSTRRKVSRRRATDGVQPLSETQPTGRVSPADCQSINHRHKRRSTRADENEQRRCPHGKKNATKCSQCRHKVLDTALSPTQCETKLNEQTTDRSPPQPAVKTTTVPSSKLLQASTTDEGDNTVIDLVAEQSTANHKTVKRRGTGTRPKSSTRHRKEIVTENDEEEAAKADCITASNRSFRCQEVAAVGETMDEKEENKLLTASTLIEERKTPNVPTARPRSLRLRKVKSRTRADDVETCTDVSGQNDSKGKELKLSRDKLLMDSARVKTSCENGGSPQTRKRTPTSVTVIASTTNDAVEMRRPGPIHDISAEVSTQNIAAEDEKRVERKVQRRRRPQQHQSNCANTSSQRTIGKIDNDMICGDHSAVESDYLLTQRLNECDHIHPVNVKATKTVVESTRRPLELDGGEQQEAAARAGDEEGRRQRRRTESRLTSSEAPSGEYLQTEQQCEGRHTADLNDQTSLSFQRRRRRRRHNDSPVSSRLDVELQRHETTDAPTLMSAADRKHQSGQQYRSPSERSPDGLPMCSPYSLQQCNGLDSTANPSVENSSLTLMEGSPRTTSICRPDDASLSTSSRCQGNPRRRSRCVAVIGSNSCSVDLPAPEVVNGQLQVPQDGIQFEFSHRSESSPAQQKPCLSAAARRCRRVKLRRSRYLND